jgi:hypothetical protein
MLIQDLLNNEGEKVMEVKKEKIVEIPDDEDDEIQSINRRVAGSHFKKTPAILCITHANLTSKDLLQTKQ